MLKASKCGKAPILLLLFQFCDTMDCSGYRREFGSRGGSCIMNFFVLYYLGFGVLVLCSLLLAVLGTCESFSVLGSGNWDVRGSK